MRLYLPVIAAFFALLPATAQEIKLPPGLDKLADKASEVVDVTMDGALLQLASRFLSDRDPDEARVKKLITGLKGIFVKSFQFDKPGQYLESDVDMIRAQLRGPGWTRVVGVRSKKQRDNSEVFIHMDGNQIGGLAVIAANPTELTIVTINGRINPDELRDLGGHFGIPKLDIDPGKNKKEDER